ncbi:MAG: hypothetical protein NTY98_11725 [Verrucomicrobia bacterium]|nr:hypothetical protein [Verrucomicrobiota bacterium]
MKLTHPTSVLSAAIMLSLCMSSLLGAADLGLKNGDFTTGKQFWRGDGTVVTLPDGNKVLEMNSTTRQQSEAYQDLKTGSLVEVEVKFRARFIGEKGQMRARLVRKSGGSTLFAFDLPSDGTWRDISFKHQRDSVEDGQTLLIETLPYKGKLQIDDVWAGEPGTHTSVRPIAATPTPVKPTMPTPAPMPAVPTPAPVPAVAPAPKPAAPAEAAVSKEMNPDVPLTALQSAISTKVAETAGLPGSFQEQHARIVKELTGYDWMWAPTRNYSSLIRFKDNGEVIHSGHNDVNGDWQVAQDGTVVYRRGDDRSLVWLLRVAAPGRFEGIGAGGAAAGRSVILSRAVDAAPIIAKFAGTQWTWGSGGIFKLEPNGVATHSAWNKEGTWVAMNDTTIFVKRPANDPPMIVEFDDALSQGKVTSHIPTSTTITRKQ